MNLYEKITPLCLPGGGGSSTSIAVALSDATPDFGDSVTVTPTPTNLTAPITYTMSAKNNIGYFVETSVVDGTFTYNCPFAGTFNIRVSAVDSLGNRAENVASITVGALHIKYSATAEYNGKDQVLIGNYVDSIVDGTGNGHNATAVSSVTRMISQKDPRFPASGMISASGSNSQRRLETSLSQLVPTITYAFIMYNSDDGSSGAYGYNAIIGGNGVLGAGARYDLIKYASTKKILVAVRDAAANAGVSFQSTNAFNAGINIGVMTYDGATLRLNFNGTVQTSAYAGSLYTPVSSNIVLGNTNVNGNMTGGGTDPLSYLFVKTSALSSTDADNLYNDLRKMCGL